MKLKSWPGWIALVVVAVGLVVLGAVRSTGPRTNLERRNAITRTLKCPVCAGESVYESRVPVAVAIRDEVANQIAAGRSDDAIRSGIEAKFPGTELTPPSTGLASLVWILPVVALGAAIGGLATAFARWRRPEADGPTDDDRTLVAAALVARHETHPES